MKKSQNAQKDPQLSHSVIKVLSSEIGYKRKITSIEIDPAVIKLVNDYFNLNQIPNLKVINSDALDFVKKNDEKNAEIDAERNQQYIAKFETLPFKTKALPRLERHNELIILEKLSE